MVLIVALWILGILTLLAVGVGYQTSLQLRIVRYQRDRLKASALAQTALNRAIAILEKDPPNVDSLADAWATGKDSDGSEILKEVVLQGQGIWSVRYDRPDPADPSGKPKPVYALRDEERKINLNLADQDLLKRILDTFWSQLQSPPEGMDASTLAQAIVAWRLEDPANPPREEWYVTGKPKKRPFDQLEELFLFTGMTPELFDKLKEWVTVYGGGKVNVNTAPRQVLEILVDPPPNGWASLIGKIVAFRVGDDGILGTADDEAFENAGADDMKGKLGILSLDEENALRNKLVSGITVQSKRFRIEAVGVVAGGKIQKRLEAVVEMEDSGGARQLSKTLSFHDGG